MESKDALYDYANRLRLYGFKNNIDSIIRQAQIEKPTYLEFITDILKREIEGREERDLSRRLSYAHLPKLHDLDNFDFNFCEGITKMQMKELRELIWLEQAYNIILMGPSGTGKTFIASGLVYEAVKSGMKAYLMTMEEIVTIIKMKEISTSAMAAYNRMLKANLIAIDDIMLFPVKKEDAVGFFNLINVLHEKTSIIITTNKAPTEWAQTLNDEVLASALLDRLLYRCEVISLKGASYRIENRKTIFNNNEQKNGK